MGFFTRAESSELERVVRLEQDFVSLANDGRKPLFFREVGVGKKEIHGNYFLKKAGGIARGVLTTGMLLFYAACESGRSAGESADSVQTGCYDNSECKDDRECLTGNKLPASEDNPGYCVDLEVEERPDVGFDAGNPVDTGRPVRDVGNPREDVGLGGKIVFSSDRDGNEEIYVMNANGTDQRRLTNNPGYDTYPSWSPDSSKIAFTSRREGKTEIYIMNADGSNQINLTNNEYIENSPSWSPDGRKIAFESVRDENRRIYIMNSDGSNQIRLTSNGDENSHPSWSPDGGKIAYVAKQVLERKWDLYTVNLDGGGHTLVSEEFPFCRHPSWSPDGSRIALDADIEGARVIYIINSDGENPARLTDLNGLAYKPSWSPDGSKIAFGSKRGGDFEIYVMNYDGSDQIRLTHNGGKFPDWSP
jgi:Tol biopolymer transport system component